MGLTQKILVVDENKQIYDYLSNFIPLLGEFEVEHASSLMQALAKANAFEPILILYDLDMYPQAHAKNVLREIRRRHVKSKTLVMVSDSSEEPHLKKEGFDDILVKSFDLTDLSHHVKTLLPLKNETSKKSEFVRLLVVGQEKIFCNFIAENFLEMGMEVYTARDGEEALEIFQKKNCNLAIVDLVLPKMTGHQLIEKLQISTHPPCPKDIVAICASLGQSIQDSRRQGYCVVERPLNLVELEKLILKDCKKYKLAIKKQDETVSI